ncbi:hypothetical protein [Candidatus Palauibacter sp.]|uniref:hypothetical protein n=1 Tax=Candidatus Palauibacter sp. TaxID=3101350 RepID=UPI003B02B97C
MTHTAPDGEVHRADIKTPTGIVTEVQHSTMTDEERESREAFYENLIWIVDGRSFRNRFHVGWMLPDPNAAGFEDIVWFHQPRDAFKHTSAWTRGVSPFWRISEERTQYPDLMRENIERVMPPDRFVLFHDGDGIRELVETNYLGHHQFCWVRPRGTWFDAKCPVYIDFGEAVLYQIVEYDKRLGLCVRLVAKRKLIHDAMVEDRAEDIATRFYPIASTTDE